MHATTIAVINTMNSNSHLQFCTYFYYIITIIIVDFRHLTKYYTVLRKPSPQSRESLLSGRDLQFILEFYYKTFDILLCRSSIEPIFRIFYNRCCIVYKWRKVSTMKIFLLLYCIGIGGSQLVSDIITPKMVAIYTMLL